MKQHRVLTIAQISLLLFGLMTGPASFAEGGWQYYGGNQWNARHAKFSSIDKHNVAQLVPRRVLQMGVIPYSFSASPLVVNGVMFISGSDGIVQAFYLLTGIRKWSFQHKRYASSIYPQAAALGWASNCCSNTSRGVAYADGIIFLGTIDAKVVAINAKTGKKIWEVWGV